MSSNPQEVLLQALWALYNHPDPQIKQDADKWLLTFQKSVEAWQAVDQLLMNTQAPLEALYFCAQTLHTKIVYDFQQLKIETHEPLRNSILNHLRRFRPDIAGKIPSNPSAPILTQLCLSMASLAVQMEGWTNLIPWLIKELNNQEMILILLEILSYLPEEVCNKKIIVSDDRYRQVYDELRANSPEILKFLVSFSSSVNSVDIQNRVFKCLSSWLRVGNIEAQELSANPLFGVAFEALKLPQLFDSAVDVITDLIRQSEDIERYAPVISIIIPKVMSLEGLFELARKEQNEDVAKGLCRIFAEAGECYVQLIVQGSPAALAFVELVLRCVSYPEIEVAEITFHFWYRLYKTLHRLPPEQEKDARMRIFSPHFSKLMQLLCKHVEFPGDFNSQAPDLQDDFKQLRHYIGDILKECASIVGIDSCLAQLLNELKNQMVTYSKTQKWEPLESVLFCIRSVAQMADSSKSQHLQEIMTLVTQMPPQTNIRYTATLIVGGYADWLKEQPNFLVPLFSFVTSGLEIPQVQSAAALAMKHACDACCNLMVPYIDSVFRIYQQSSSLDIDDQLEIIEGIGYVVTVLPPAQVPAAMETLISPIFFAIQQHMQKGEAKPITQELKKLKTIFQFSNPFVGNSSKTVHPFVPVSQKLWPLLEALLVQFQSNEPLIDSCCRAIKYIVLSLKVHFSPFFIPVLEKLTSGFEKTHFSCFLYIFIQFVDIFGPLESFHSILSGAFDSFSTSTFKLLSNLENFRNLPDVVEEYFHLVGRYLRRCPFVVLRSPNLMSLFQCGIAGLSLQHREASKAILSFFETLICLGIPSTRDSNPSHLLETRKILEALLNQYGYPMMKGLIFGAAGALPHSRLSQISIVMKSSFQFNAQMTQNWISAALQECSRDYSLDAKAKEDFLRTVISQQNSESHLKEALRVFSMKCREKDQQRNTN